MALSNVIAYGTDHRDCIREDFCLIFIPLRAPATWRRYFGTKESMKTSDEQLDGIAGGKGSAPEKRLPMPMIYNHSHRR
jgi:hypothetical protein